MTKSSRFVIATHALALLAHGGGDLVTSEWIAGSVNTNAVVIRRILAMLAGRLKALKGAQTVEVAPTRVTAREESVRRRVEQPQEMTPAVEPEEKPGVAFEDDSAPRGSFRAQVRPKGRQVTLF
ncbi:MAG: ywnA [Gemmataceae bacterium]|nr:ywnA [Gemmataceae bacterium]